MLPNILSYSCPSRISEAVRELSRGKGKTAILAGGTSALLHTDKRLTGFLSLKNLKLSYIRNARGLLRIGAMTRIQELLKDRTAGRLTGGLLNRACFRLGSTLNRNLITAGGNITGLFRWSDLPAALLVLDAKITVRGKKKRSVPAREFFKQHPRSLVKYNEIVTEIMIKGLPAAARTEFCKFSITDFDHAILDIAAAALTEKGICRDIRIAYSAVRPLPFRAPELEKELLGRKVTRALLEQVSRKARDTIVPAPDARVSPEYQKALIRTMTLRILEKIFAAQAP